MGLMGNGDGHTLLIFTDAESRLIREALTWMEKTNGRASGPNGGPLDAFNLGVIRGTAKLTEEFKAKQARKKAAKK